MRSAPRAPMRAAPVCASGPDTTSAWPRSYLWPARLRTRKRRQPEPRSVGPGAWLDLAQHRGRDADVGGAHGTAVRAPRQQQVPRLAAEEGDGAARLHDRPVAAPVVPSSPLGTSTARTGQPEAFIASTAAAAAPSSGRVSPAPNRASTMSCAPSSCRARERRDRACVSAAPWRRHRPSEPRGRRAGQGGRRSPASRRWRAATKPSPPLLPGPQRTAMRAPAGAISAASSATARPAFSMSVRLGTPAATARRSARAISAVVKQLEPGHRSPQSQVTRLRIGQPAHSMRLDSVQYA